MLNRSARFLCLRIFVWTGCAILLLGLFNLQILKHDYYLAKAELSRTLQKTLNAKRGEIFMLDGAEKVTPVVMNERTWTVFVDPSYVSSRDKVETELGRILGDAMIVSWDKVWSDMTRQYVEIAKNVEYREMAQIKELSLRGVGQIETSKRIYPSKTLASQVLGFLNAEGVGSGIEGALNERLSGRPGLLKTVADVNSVPLSIGDDNIEIPAQDGENVALTLDINVQRKVESVLESAVKRRGAILAASALVVNPNTGEIYAMANYPSFNPEEYWRVDDASVYINRTTASPYEPASTCKPFTYAVAINEGRITPETTYYNTGSTVIEDRTIWNANRSMNNLGPLTYRRALELSYNTGSVEALKVMGDGAIGKTTRQTFYNYLSDFGLGKKTGIELYEEAGRVISPEELEGNAVRYANMTFGQGMNLTMVQLAAGFSAIVNGGNYYQPTIVAGQVDANGHLRRDVSERESRQVIKSETSATMRSMLEDVRRANGGAGDLPGYRVGVKTGTSETYDANGVYTSDRTIAGAIGYGAAGDPDAMPEYVILVRLDGSALLWGAEDAIPVFTEISNYMLQYLRIKPSN